MGLKVTGQGELVRETFKGEMLNIISCDECDNQKERVENFYIQTVEVKNQNNLKDCLDKLIEPEIICDYYCEWCDRRVESIQKYHRFQSLPPYLFIHQQRLVFDLETFTKVKLDHPVSFPLELDLNPYFLKARGDANYVLTGFVVHLGNSEGGHYYSIIRTSRDRWVRYDDTRVDDWSWAGSSGNYDKDNAYMLVYVHKDVSHFEKSAESVVKIGNPELMHSVRKDNSRLVKEKIFLQPSFSRYLVDTLQKVQVPPEYQNNPNGFSQAYHPEYQLLPEGVQPQLQLCYKVAMKNLLLQSEFKQLNLSSEPSTRMKDENEPEGG